MKTTAKIISAVLALCLTLCLSAAAFADDGFGGIVYIDEREVSVYKLYKLVGDGVSPAETFTLVQVGDGVVKDGDALSAPALGTITGAAFAEGAASANGTEGAITIALPEYERVGVYEYTLAEVAGTTAGVSYYANTIRLVVTVINDNETGRLRIAAVHTESIGAEKSDTFPNTYSAGKLNISKTVTGNLGDLTKYFTFTVTLTGEDGRTYADSFAVSGGSNERNPSVIKLGEPTTFYLKSDDTITIANLPYGVSYTVTEDTPEDYTLTKSGDSGTVNSALQTASFTNNKGGDPDTGISLDSIPYVITLALVVAGAAVLTMKKRSTR